MGRGLSGPEKSDEKLMQGGTGAEFAVGGGGAVFLQKGFEERGDLGGSRKVAVG